MSEPQSKDFPDSFYRVSVKGLLVRDGKILLTYDSTPLKLGDRNKAVWELPGGGMDFGETHKETLIREVKEEMGLEVTSVADKPTYFWTYRVKKSRGMDWYHVLILAFQFEVKDLNITPSPECEKIQFFSKEELQTAELNDQIEQLRDIFNPADFKTHKGATFVEFSR